MADQRGLLTGPDLNEVQEKILMLQMLKKQKRDFDDKETVFEQLLMVHRPDMYQKFQEYKDEKNKSGYDDIVWGAPETREEAEALLASYAIFEQEGRRLKQENGIEDFEEQMSALEQLAGVDISLLGDDDG